MAFNHGSSYYESSYPAVNTTDLGLYIDAGKKDSYSGTGTTWSDLSGNGYDFSLVNGASFSEEGGGSILVDGSNEYMQYTSYPTASNWTAFLTFRQDGSGTYDFRGHRTFFATPQLRFQWDDNSTLSARGPFVDTVGLGSVSGTTFTPSEFQNIWQTAAISSGTSGTVIYYNGSQTGTGGMNIVLHSTVRIGLDGVSGIGGADGLGSEDGCKIGVFLIYNRVLSSTEILQVHNRLSYRFR